MLLKIVFLISWLVNVFLAFPQTEWELRKNKNGIKVYTANEGTIKYKSVKVEAEFTGTLKKLIAVLMDVGENKKWVYNTKRSHLLEKINENEILYYAETHLPWPMSNRDMAIRMHFDLDTGTNILKITANGEPDAVPKKSRLVRIPYFMAVWNVKQDGETKIIIDYFLSVNPGGTISPDISNMFVSKGPFETFNNLAKILKD